MDFKEGVILRLNNPYLFEEEKDAPMSEYLYEYSLLVGGERNLLFTERLLRSLGLLVEEVTFGFNKNKNTINIVNYGTTMGKNMREFYNKLATYIDDSQHMQFVKPYIEKFSGGYLNGRLYLKQNFNPSILNKKPREKEWLESEKRLKYSKDKEVYYIELTSQDMEDINKYKSTRDYIQQKTTGQLRNPRSEQMLRDNQRAADARIAANKARLALPRN